jgi:hypothetical protein
MVIGKSKNPRCFKNIKLPEMHYRSSKSSWQTQSLFKEWFFDSFVPAATKNLQDKNLPAKAILSLDNATAHCDKESLTTEDGNFTVHFFPPNTTALLQPLDQHIIKSVKTGYRKKLLLKLASMNGDDVGEKLKKINMKDVVYGLTESWNETKSSVIKNGFKHLFQSTDDITLNLPPDHFDEDDHLSIAALYRQVLCETRMTDEQIQDWAAGFNENSRSLISDDDIVDNINTEDATGDNMNLTSDKIPLPEVIKGLNTVIDWAESNLELGEILFLRNIRERALQENLSE